ncbi:MAG: sugar transferase [Candidatus Omnitrophica bacterium]|nr:sugar transferase [Candidatus Omnitrophota bacterium]
MKTRLRRFQGFKRGFDFLVAGLGLILLSPLFLIVSILIRIDFPGPAFFRQERLGKDGKIFKMWKFRTMNTDAELETGPVWAAEGDPRITRLGRFLRKSHIDEIPQLINVFKGEMSLIGPRPERPVFVEKINGDIPNFNDRLRVKPGITGLAQVRYRYGASIKDAARKLKYDLLYIKRMCWILDFQIILWTFGRVLTGEGAR